MFFKKIYFFFANGIKSISNKFYNKVNYIYEDIYIYLTKTFHGIIEFHLELKPDITKFQCVLLYLNEEVLSEGIREAIMALTLQLGFGNTLAVKDNGSLNELGYERY